MAEATLEQAPAAAAEQHAPDNTGLVSMAANFDALLKDVMTPKPEEAAPEAKAPEVETAPEKPAEKAGDKTPEQLKAEADTAAKLKADTDAKAKEIEMEKTDGFSPKASEKFTALKASRDRERTEKSELQKQVDALRVENETLKKTPASTTSSAELEQMRRERDQLNEIVKVHAIQSHPKFKEYFDRRTGEAINVAKQIVGGELAPQVEAALKLADPAERDEALQTVMDELPTVRATRLGAALAELDKIGAERAQAIADAGKNAESLAAGEFAETQKREKLVEAQRTQAIDVATKAAANFDAFKPIEGNEKHNAEVAGRKQFITEFMHGQVKPELIPLIPVMVGEYLHYKTSVLPAKDAHIAKLEKQLKELQGAAPTPGDGGQAQPAAAGGEPKGFIQAFKEGMATIQH